MKHKAQTPRGIVQRRRFGSALLLSIVICSGLAIAVLYKNSLSGTAGQPYSSSILESVRNFAATNAVNRTYTAKGTVIINNLWKPTYKIVGGLYHTCALTNGRVYCWGRNDGGQLGNGTFTNSSVPVLAAGGLSGKNVTAITAGGGHTCAIANGQAYCWGGNGSGRLGNGPNNGVGGVNSGITNQPSPVPVATSSGAMGTKNVTAIAGGGYHTCAIADNQAFCWGRGGEGQLGNSQPANPNAILNPPGADQNYYSAVPVLVSGGSSSVTAIATGSSHTCAVASGLAYCWGGSPSINGDFTHQGGRLGNGGNNNGTNVNIPTAVSVLAGGLQGKVVTSIAAGSAHTCAIADGKAYCWGPNLAGEIGTGSASTSNVPAAVSTSSPSALPASAVVNNISTGIYTDLSQYQTCAVADGTAYCWGSNTYGQLGNGSTTNSLYPVAVNTSGVLSSKNVSEVTPGSPFACVVANGRAYCWGYNNYGQLGDGTTTNRNMPVRVLDSYY